MAKNMFFYCLLILLSFDSLLKESQVIASEVRDFAKRDTNEVTHKERSEEAIEAKAQKAPGANADIDYTVCDQRFCLGLGGHSDNCVEHKKCEILLSVVVNKNEDHMEFELSGKSNDRNGISKYYSMAFSKDPKMGDDLVIDCLVTSDGKVKVRSSYNNGKSNELNDEYKDSLKTIHTNYANGRVVCKWKSNRYWTLGNQEWDLLSRKYHLLLAMGKLEDDLGNKEYHSAKLASHEVNLEEVGAISVSDPIYLVRIHGAFMVIAWVGTVSLAIIMARYFKNTWVESTLCGVKIWFAFHRGLMVTSVVLMLIAQTCIFYYLKEYRFGLHQILGSLAFTLALLNPLGALLRPHPDADNRWLFNWGHWALGNIGHITAIVAIFVSTSLKLADLPKQFLWTVISFVLFYVVIHLILQFHTFCTQNRKSHDIALQDMHQSPDAEPMGTDAPGSGFRRFILGIYSVVILGFVIAMVSLICLPKSTLDLMAIT